MAETSHGIHIPEPGESRNVKDLNHVGNCIACRQEIGEYRLASDRRKNPMRTEDDVIKAQNEPEKAEILTVSGRPTVVRPEVWEEKTWPIEAKQIRLDNIEALAMWCGGQVNDNREENMPVSDLDLQLRVATLRGILVGQVGDYVFKYRHSQQFDVLKREAFEEKYRRIGLRGKDI